MSKGKVACIEVTGFGFQRNVTVSGLSEFENNEDERKAIVQTLLEAGEHHDKRDGSWHNWLTYKAVDYGAIQAQRGGVFYKTTIEVVVLSEDPIPAGMELDSIIRECDSGAFVRGDGTFDTEEINAEDMRRELEDAGSDPEFFSSLMELI